MQDHDAGRSTLPFWAEKLEVGLLSSGFFFFIFKKIKISKIYVGFGKFQKYTPVALWGGDRAQM